MRSYPNKFSLSWFIDLVSKMEFTSDAVRCRYRISHERGTKNKLAIPLDIFLNIL